MTRLRLQVLVLAVLLVTALVVGVRSLVRVRRSLAAEAVCQAVERGDLQTALALTEDLSGTNWSSLRQAECRCAALMETGQRLACIALLEDLLSKPETGDWLPMPLLTAVLVEERRDTGRRLEAADLAHRGALRYPEDFILLYLELSLRRQLENESLVLEEMEHRLATAGETAPRWRLQIAEEYLNRRGWVEALELLGPEPRVPEELLGRWYSLRSQALGGLGRIDELRANFAAWQAAGLHPLEARARYAITLSLNNLNEPETPTHAMLEQVLDAGDQLADPELRKAVYYRLIGALVVGQRHDEALAYFDRGMEELGDLHGISREDLLRARSQGLMPLDRSSPPPGSLLFSPERIEPGDRLLVSPEPESRLDTDFELFSVPATGRLQVDRHLGTAPQRWVLRDRQERVVASGAVWPVPARSVEVSIQRRSPVPPSPSYEPQQQPADGRRRIFVTLLDCADWHLVQYGRARGELPVFDALARRGLHGVLNSDPPFTAVAVHALAFPGKQGVSSFFDMLYQLGVEIETMNFVGHNPAAGLAWLLPKEQDLFSTLGATHLGTVNMLRSFGPVQVGRSAEIIGPYGEVRKLTGFRGSRPLRPKEKELFPGLFDPETARHPDLVEEMAADFDVLLDLAADETVDLVILRLDALDVFTHAHFAEASSSGQDDGDRPLFWIYRYIDHRLGQLFDALDEDDILIILSDHGIRTAFEHDTRAIFLAAGGEVHTGQIPGTPDLRGIGRMLADLFGVPSSWPTTGVEAWVRELPSAQTR